MGIVIPQPPLNTNPFTASGGVALGSEVGFLSHPPSFGMFGNIMYWELAANQYLQLPSWTEAGTVAISNPGAYVNTDAVMANNQMCAFLYTGQNSTYTITLPPEGPTVGNLAIVGKVGSTSAGIDSNGYSLTVSDPTSGLYIGNGGANGGLYTSLTLYQEGDVYFLIRTDGTVAGQPGWYIINALCQPVPTTVNGTSGSLTWTQPEDFPWAKKVVITFSAFVGSHTITFHAPFSITPSVSNNLANLTTFTVSTTNVVISCSSAVTGTMILQGV